ncbi:metalloregulator ArsR/SmtB family transcription factor [Marinovum sp. 2_MG-2023]|uniref:ArsR/SmtB family transcription factor n=1 Tax=unclassified Marinovum TaxID=2647166 RepID=UPI0026E38225|nr:MULTISPECIES: metalloregulator ArsR/SmtB family transcription factor [unclassified Marinovum]MDO6731427.1 metalloregulator ArsR/SmtB family transcription factor [Marinovum sp. 2_MG-2023]MDO6780674.1 metalloregulator ArsR/SmtB family transcription factor [Marinovum sp. 1_MG-2023]
MAKYDPSLDALFTALGEPTRRDILTRLARGPASVGELHGHHDMALPSFMAHITRLESAGLIATNKEGRSRICEMQGAAITPALHWLEAQRAVLAGRLDRFDDYVLTLMEERENDP